MYGKTRTGIGLPLICDTEGILLTKNGGGKYADAALNGRLFVASNQAAVATTAALATTWTGLGLCNPTGSGKLLIVHEFGWGLSVLGPDDGVVGLMTSTDTGFASAIAARCCRNAYATSIAYVDDGATIATPVLERICGAIGIGATNLVNGTGPFIVNLEGSIILAPGRSVLTYTTTATTAALLFHFMWEEVDA